MSELLQRWNALHAEANGIVTFGQSGVRDPEHPCVEFLPGEPSGDCMADGHYMCGECSHRVVGCIGCGQTAERCECPTCERERCWEVAVFERVYPDSAIRQLLCLDHAEALGMVTL